MTAPRVVGLDLSLTSTGVACVTRGDGLGHDVQVRRVLSKPTAHPSLADRSRRLRRLAGETTALCAGAALIVVEGPAYASTSGAAHDRAGYWWLVVGRLTGAGLNVVEVPPASVKTYATGKGNAGKDDVLTAAVRRYPHVEFAGNDEADALVLAAMGARFAGFPIEDALPQTHLRALEKVQWHPTTR